MAVFQWPVDWVPFTQEPERPAAYKVTRAGNLEVALDLTREIAGARLEAPLRGLATAGEISEAIEGPVMNYEPGRKGPVMPPREPGTYILPFQEPGRPVVRPIMVMGPGGVPIEAPSRERRPARPYQRREFAVALIPGAAVREFREYLRRLPVANRQARWYVWGAAWAIYLSEIQAPTFGYFVQAAARGELVYTIPGFPPTENLPRTVQRAARPSQVPDTVLTDSRGGRFVPVFFFSVAALLRYVMGTELRSPDFDHAMRDNEWRVCARVPRAGNAIWCPSRPPSRREREEIRAPGTQVPLPSATETGEAQPIRPRQQLL